MLAFFKLLPQTFYSVPFYQRLVKEGRGIGLGFLFFATFLGLVQAIVHYSGPIGSLWNEREAIFNALPPLSIQNGAISIDAPSPLDLTFLENVKEGPLKIVFDIEADASDNDHITKRMDDQSIFLLVTRSKIFLYDKNTGRAEVTDIKTMKDVTITHEKWIETGYLFSALIPLSLAFSMSFLLFLGHLVTAFAGGLCLFVVAPLFKLNPPLSALLRIAAAAKIPVGFVFLIAAPNPLIQLPLWLGFAVFGLLATRQTGSAA